MSKMVEELDEVRGLQSVFSSSFVSVPSVFNRGCLMVCVLGHWSAVQEVSGVSMDPHCHMAHGYGQSYLLASCIFFFTVMHKVNHYLLVIGESLLYLEHLFVK